MSAQIFAGSIDTHVATPVSPGSPGILETVYRRFRESSYYYLRSVECSFDSGVLTLRGRVPTFYLRQIVQSIAEKIDGVHAVVNMVDVHNPAARSA